MKNSNQPYKPLNPVRLVWLIIFLGSFACLQIALTGWWTLRDIRSERENLDALRMRIVGARSVLEQRLEENKWEYYRLLEIGENEPRQQQEQKEKSLKELAHAYQMEAGNPELAELFGKLAEEISGIQVIHSQCLHWARSFKENSFSLPLTRRHTLAAFQKVENAFGKFLNENGSGQMPYPGLQKNLAELQLIVERIRGEEDIESLGELRDRKLLFCLAELRKNANLKEVTADKEAAVLPYLFKELEELLLGKGYSIEGEKELKSLGIGGLLNQTEDRLALLVEREKIRDGLLRNFDEIRAALRDVVEGVESSTEKKTVRVEQMLRKAWLTILFVALSAAAVFFVASSRIIIEIRKQIRTIEAANRVLDASTKELLQSQEELSESKDRLEYLSGSLLNAQENERRRVSRELHDELGQAMAVLKLQVREAEKILGDNTPDALREECRKLREHINQIIENVRRLSRDLSPVALEDLGLQAAVENLAENFTKFHNVKIDLDIHEIIHLVSEDKQRNVYRILQEVLSNIGKHAQAGFVQITVSRHKKFLSFTISDDGKGFDVDAKRKRLSFERGLGLTTMAERVRMLGGKLEIQSKPGLGTTVNFTAAI